MKLKYNRDGATGGKVLGIFIVILVVVVLISSGYLNIGLPGGDTDYEDTVIRNPTSVGMVVPIQFDLIFSQNKDSSKSDQSNIDVYVKHKHSTGSNEVPDASVIGNVQFNTQVGIQDDGTKYAVNGNGFSTSITFIDVPVNSVTGANMELGQKSYKIWRSGGQQMHEPDDSLGVGNHCLLLQMIWRHYQRGTGYMLSSDTLNLLVYYLIPNYNDEESYTQSFTYNVFVPFSDFAVVEDIQCYIKGFYGRGFVTYRNVVATSRVKWSWKVILEFFPPKIGVELVKEREVSVETAITYNWDSPRTIETDNGQRLGSHHYLYKIR